MFHYQESIQDSNGVAQNNWSVDLCSADTDPIVAPAVPIYSNRAGTAAISGNRVKATDKGYIDFYVASGRYTRRYYNAAGVYQYAILDGDVGLDYTFATDLASTATGKGASLIGVAIAGTTGDLDKVSDTAGVPISFFGTIGTSDDSLVFQAWIDALDGTGVPGALTGNVNLRGNVYLGDTAIRFNGYSINCIIDNAFTQRGSATNRTVGVILTKSAASAGYGRTTVGITFLDRATINTTRTVDTGTVQAGLLFENTSKFAATDLYLNSTSTGVYASSATPLYLYSGIQGVTIDTINLTRAQGSSQGGIFIVSRDPARASRDINIGQIIATGDGYDEFVALYTSADANADMSDVHIGSIACVCNGGSACSVSVFRNVGSYDATKMRNITIGTVKVEVNSMAFGTGGVQPFVVKFDKSVPRIGKVEIEFNATFPGTMTAIAGLRGPLQSAQPILPYIDDFSFRMNSTNIQPSGNADVANGTLDFGRFAISGAGSGWKYGGRYIRSIADARIGSIALDPSSNTFVALEGAESVTGYVDGRMNNVYNFRGVHVINTDHITAAFWWFHNAAPTTNWQNVSPVALSYDAEVRISGAGTVSRIIQAQSSPTNPVPINVRYRASNPSSLTITNPDTVSGKAYFPTGQYNAVLVTGATASQRGRTTTLTVATGAITPIFEYHLVTTGGVLSDILGPNGGTPYDGQEVTLRATTGGTFTVKHNTGSAGTKTFTGTGADIVVNDAAGAWLIYNAAAGRWELRS